MRCAVVELVLILILGAAWPVRVDATHDGRPRRVITVLLVGNSYTLFNGLPAMLQRFADSAPGPRIEVDAAARGGYTLRMHLRRNQVEARIASGRYSHVVLQGHSLGPLRRAKQLEASVGRLHGLIADAGAKTILYETWARRADARLYRRWPGLAGPKQMLTRVVRTYEQLSDRYGVPIAPVGRAFSLAAESWPKLRLYLSDSAHPSLGGSYLAASVLYGAIAGVDPRGGTYRPRALPEAAARRCRELAADALQAQAMQHQVRFPVSAADVAQVAH